MMLYTFMLYSGLALLGWNEHTVGDAPHQHRVWVHASGLVVYQQ